MARDHVDGQDQMILLAALRLGDEAYALSIIRELDQAVGRKVSRGSLYKSLDRLREKGLVTWRTEEGTPDRGGKPRRVFSVTDRGIEALREARHALLTLWDGLVSTLQAGIDET